ncbi:MAG: MFS transporter [Syntrophales bacterium]|nr:MFS transporter [Syntrophales bacterium]
MTVNPAASRLFTFEFLAMCLVITTAFCNVSVFYSFYYYLGAIDIPVAWRGFLVGLEPMAAFALRLFVMPWLHVRNAYGIIMVSLILLIAVSCSYLFVTTVTGMIVLRVIHGAVFVLLTSALISLMVNFIPPDKSGQGFSALAVATMVPYAVIPPLTEALLPHLRNEADIYAGVSILSVAAILLMMALRRRIGNALEGLDTVLVRRPDVSELRDNFRQRTLVILLISVLLIYLAHATLFYFMKNLSLQTGVGNVGVFFTISMMMMIAVRVFGGVVFDKLNKPRLIMIVLVMLIACLAMLPNVVTLSNYYLLAAVYGVSIGVALPILNALIFSASLPALRGLNTNMTLFAMDAGYFITPYLGGMLVTLGETFDILFYLAALFVLICLSLIMAIRHFQKGD